MPFGLSKSSPPEDEGSVSEEALDGSDEASADSAVEAQDFVEQQLGDGVGQEDVTAFSARRLAFHVSHRPIVKLLTQEE